jgi:hypothetical protein
MEYFVGNSNILFFSDKRIAGIIESMKIWNKAYSPVSVTQAIIYRW